MDARSTFLFDLNGFIVVRGAVPQAEVDEMNAAIDSRLINQHSSDPSAASFRRRDAPGLKNAIDDEGSVFAAAGPRGDMGGHLAWDETPLFRKMLAHPNLIPYITTMVGEGYRLDHQPLLILQDTGSEGFSLHGGPLVPSNTANVCTPDPGYLNPELQYRCVNGKMHNTLVAMAVCLCDTGPEDGGFVVVKGSHKLNFAVPQDFATLGDWAGEENLYHPITKKGDVIFFSEATVHGAMAWHGEHQRRLALYRFAPSNCAYGRAYIDRFASFGADVLGKCTPEQRAVLEFPYSWRLDREYAAVDEDGSVKSKTFSRSEEKKAHDRTVFGTTYY